MFFHFGANDNFYLVYPTFRWPIYWTFFLILRFWITFLPFQLLYADIQKRFLFVLLAVHSILNMHRNSKVSILFLYETVSVQDSALHIENYKAARFEESIFLNRDVFLYIHIILSLDIADSQRRFDVLLHFYLRWLTPDSYLPHQCPACLKLIIILSVVPEVFRSLKTSVMT